MTLGDKIAELRAENKISQKKLADNIGISQSAIAQIEINRNEGTASTIRKLAKYFNVSTDYLLGLEDDLGIKQIDNANALPAYSKEEQQLIEDYRALNSSGKKLVKQTINTLLSNFSSSTANNKQYS